MFNQSKYTKWYFSIVEQAKLANRKKKEGQYYESHHITPESLGGSNSKSNLVLLTAREHFLCHLLLPKMTIDKQHTVKMVYAFFRMKHKHHNSRLFHQYRESYGSRLNGENNLFYGKKHSTTTLAKISGSNHHMFGKHHTEESKQLMSASKRGKNTGADNHMYGKQHTTEWKIAHSERLSGENHFNFGKPAFTKGRIWVNNGEQSRMVDPNLLEQLQSEGWTKGRLLPK